MDDRIVLLTFRLSYRRSECLLPSECVVTARFVVGVTWVDAIAVLVELGVVLVVADGHRCWGGSRHRDECFSP